MSTRLFIIAALVVLLNSKISDAHPTDLLQWSEPPSPTASDKGSGTLQWLVDPKIPFTGSPVHEEMTKRTITLSNVHERGFSAVADSDYVAGAFWNDDPENLLCPSCSIFSFANLDRRLGLAFLERFKEAEAQAHATPPHQFGKKDGLLERSHFGDMQFLHAMAASNGELASETYALAEPRLHSRPATR